ncbi:MAG: hypothetical protein IKB50_00595 [Clostridia bacterium]|nr:hypothetical protein [Clostridia bacterium]
MKRFLSILLSVLLVMSAMTTVAFADSSEITLSTVMTFAEGDIAVAGTKVLFNVAAPAGAELTYYNNGVAVAAEAMNDDGSVVALPVVSGKNSFTVSDGTNTSAPVVLNGKGIGTVWNKVADEDILSQKHAGKGIAVDGAIGGVTDTWQGTVSGRWGIGAPAAGETFEYKTDIYFDGALSAETVLSLYCGGWLHNNFRVNANGTIGLSQGSDGQLYDSFRFVANKWYNVRMVITDIDTGVYDMYVDDVLVLKDRKHATWSKDSIQAHLSTDVTLTDGVVTANTGVYRKNFEANFVTYTDVDFLAPAGDVYGDKVGVNIRGIAPGEKAVAYVNGVPSDIATADGFASITLPEGYSAVSVAIVTAAGNTAWTSEEVVYYRLTPVGEETIAASATWEEDKYTEEDATTQWPVGSRKFTGVNPNWDDSVIALGFEEVQENGNTYLTATSWGIAASSGFDGAGNAGRINFISTSKDVSGMVEVSVDYRYDNYYAIDSATGDVLAEADIADAQAVRTLVHPKSNVSGISAMPIMALWMTYYADETNYIRESLSPFQYNGTTGLLELRTDYVKKSSGITSTVKTMDVDMGEWHNYKTVVDTDNNKMYLYLDGALVASGSAYTDNTASRDVDYIFWPQASGTACYSDAYLRVTNSIDNFRFATYADGLEAKTTDAFVNDSANGIGLVLENMTAAEKVADMAVVAIAADGSVNINKFDAAASEAEYKFIKFAKPAEKIFVWAWDTIAPITEVFEIN